MNRARWRSLRGPSAVPRARTELRLNDGLDLVQARPARVPCACCGKHCAAAASQGSQALGASSAHEGFVAEGPPHSSGLWNAPGKGGSMCCKSLSCKHLRRSPHAAGGPFFAVVRPRKADSAGGRSLPEIAPATSCCEARGEALWALARRASLRSLSGSATHSLDRLEASACAGGAASRLAVAIVRAVE